MKTTNYPRILIARMSAVGDTILTLPVACALRKQFPNAFLSWVVERGASPMVVGHRDLDEVIVLDRLWFASAPKLLAARKKLRQLQVDIAIDCQSITKTALACRLSGAPLRIGCQGRYGSEASPWLNNRLVTPATTHLTDRSLELLRPLGIQDATVAWGLPIPSAAQRKAESIQEELRVGEDYAIVNPGATWDSRLWDLARFGDVAKHLARRHGMRTVAVWGTDQERGWAQTIVAHSGGHAVLAPRTTLLELAALIERATIFVSSDTGPLHMAVAVGTPSVGLHGATRPQDSGAYGWPHVGIQVRFQDGSRRERRRADNSAMLEITSQMVADAVDRVMSRTHFEAA